jgi:hypothetical protein
VNDHNQNADIRLCLSPEDIIQKNQSQFLEIPFQSPMMTTEIANMTQIILEFLDDLGCQQFVESEVFQVDMIVPLTRFASVVNGMLVCEIKFFRDCPRHKDLYEIQVLRGMEGVPGFAKLVGIVVDRSKKHLKSYLVETLQSKWDFISDLVTTTSVIPWERRENWAKQVVEVARQIHSKSFVIGTLWRARQPIIIEIFDHVQFWNFDKQFAPCVTRSCCYPPEYAEIQQASPSMNEAEFPDITPKADIFLLGMALWYLAMGYPTPNIGPSLSKETKKLTMSFELQGGDGSIVLSPLPEHIPKYYRDIVDECRSVDPSDRPSAWRILERFPPRSNSEHSQHEASKPRAVELSLKSMKKAFVWWIWCGYCWNGIKESCVHCDICDDGDFDICLSCYNQEIHCHNGGHLLVQLVERSLVGLSHRGIIPWPGTRMYRK